MTANAPAPNPTALLLQSRSQLILQAPSLSLLVAGLCVTCPYLPPLRRLAHCKHLIPLMALEVKNLRRQSDQAKRRLMALIHVRLCHKKQCSHHTHDDRPGSDLVVPTVASSRLIKLLGIEGWHFLRCLFSAQQNSLT
jgi:hypothetical protein